MPLQKTTRQNDYNVDTCIKSESNTEVNVFSLPRILVSSFLRLEKVQQDDIISRHSGHYMPPRGESARREVGHQQVHTCAGIFFEGCGMVLLFQVNQHPPSDWLVLATPTRYAKTNA